MGKFCLSCIKCLVFGFNFFLLLFGSVLLGIGFWIFTYPMGFKEIADVNWIARYGVYGIMGVGGLLSVLAFLGCFGACCENKCLLLVFFMIIFLIFLVELALVFLAYTSRNQLNREHLTRELREYYGAENGSIYTNTWNAIMRTFQCCGVNDPNDFNFSLFTMMNHPKLVPESCCMKSTFLLPVNLADCVGNKSTHRNIEGCYSAIIGGFEKYFYEATTAAVAVLGFELCIMVFSLCLIHGLR